jgi:hypothetical protein
MFSLIVLGLLVLGNYLGKEKNARNMQQSYG